MPDWSYRTVLRPVLLAMGPERARRIVTRTLAALARLPLGVQAIDFLGHMQAHPRLRTRAGDVELPGPVVLGSLIDPKGDALRSFARFGVGMIEIGPVVAGEGNEASPEWSVDLERQSVRAATQITVGLEEAARNLEGVDARVPVCVRIAPQDGAGVRRIVQRLQNQAALFVVDRANVADAAGERPVLAAEGTHDGADGVWIRGTAEEVRAMRASLGDGAILVAGGAAEPADVRELLDAGANAVVVDEGLICSGPGLVKRSNEALLASMPAEAAPEPFTLSAARSAWFWAMVMGASMFVGGLMAVAIASTRVVLPYDEALCGLTRAEMVRINPRLLPFMAHDRVSLAGSMLSIGIFYFALAAYGMRRGAHWAQVTVVASALAGALSFFSFLGFGYFDPFHAFVTAILTQFLVLSMALRPSPVQPSPPEWRETAAWRRGQWGQLLFVILGVGLTGAGVVMTVIGCTQVFVATDLAFMRTTAAELRVSYEHLVPLVAHDRASLGGMLIANGIAVWLAAQWGFRAGARWLWIAFAWGGNIAFACAVLVHFVVGYDEPLHLGPAILGWVLWNVALGLTRGWLRAAAAPSAAMG